jgi:hypothetical protein
LLHESRSPARASEALMQMSATARRSATVLGFLDSLDVADSIPEGIDDLDVLDVWDSVLGVVETFHIIPGVFIMLLLSGLQGFNCR